MPNRLRTRVFVNGSWYGPGDDLSDEVAGLITNPKAWAEGSEARDLSVSKRGDALDLPETPQEIALEEVKEPPRGGPGSSADAWRKFMESKGFEVPDGASAKDMQASWDDRER